MHSQVTLRAISQTDEPFLLSVYASTREEELALLDWEKQQKEQFLRMQFDAQHRYYQDQFAGADFQIVLLDGQAIGRLYVDRRPDEFRLIDIALLPSYRNAGIGSDLLKNLLAEARHDHKPVRIHVEQLNPAMRLYQRLGFVQIGESGVYNLMQWTPDEQTQDT